MRQKFPLSLILAIVSSIGCSDGRKLLAPAAVLSNPRMQGAIDLGPTSRDSTFDFVIGVALRDEPALHKFLDEQPRTRDAMTAEDFAIQFAAAQNEYDSLTTWLQAQGLEITRSNRGRTSLSVRGSAATIERAFAVAIHDFRDSAGVFAAAIGPLSLTPEISATITGTVGLHGELPWTSHMVPLPEGTGTMGSESAQDLETLYGAWASNKPVVTNPGMGETVAILGAGIGPMQSDITAWFTAANGGAPYKLTAFPGKYTQQLVGGPDRTGATADPNGEYGENCLDADMVMSFAPYANIVHVLTSTNAPGLFTDGISYIVNELTGAHAVTVSYGSCERGSSGEFVVVNALLAQAKAQGQQWFFAAGDSGGDGCRDGGGNKILSAGWPASSPYAIGVGGTQLGSGTTGAGPEQVWNTNDPTTMPPSTGAGGGGVSEAFDKPAYQMGVTPADNSRDEPDVAALAGPPYIADYPGGASAVGGTSAATPMWAGIWALIDQAKAGGKGLPMGMESLYKLGAAKKGFTDITAGNNGGPGDQAMGGYMASGGFDLATGWGSPLVSTLISSWQ
jgi:kumamolisin